MNNPNAPFGGRDSIQQRFDAFHMKHPEVYQEIVTIARRLKSAGRSRYSMDAVISVIRYHRDLSTEEDGYKMNNDFTSRYARLVMANEPDLAGFFETRGLRS